MSNGIFSIRMNWFENLHIHVDIEQLIGYITHDNNVI